MIILTDSARKRNRKEVLGNNNKTRINIGHQQTSVLLHMYRDVPKVSGHCDFLLYISYKTTFFKNIIPKSTLV